MLTHAELLKLLPNLQFTEVDARGDRTNSVSSAVVRGIYEGQRAVAVTGDSKTQIGAFVDLVDLHLHGGSSYHGQPVDHYEVSILFVENPDSDEAKDGLRTLAASIQNGPKVHLIQISADGTTRRLEPVTRTFEDAKFYRFERYRGLLLAVAQPPELLLDLVAKAGHPSFRAYPMLTQKGRWSLRLEGLEVGRFRGGEGVLDVGKPGKFDGVSAQRKAWLATGAPHALPVTSTEESINRAATVLREFANAWLPQVQPGGGAEPKQDEHALESRILRGLVPIRTSDGARLTLLRPPPHVHADGPDGVVNWGSQFPTRWGRTNASSARYLDALLRDGSRPWALEIKVEGSAGVGQYYRHAVVQAVLYRQFIRTATPLKEWFDRYELNQADCGAAVVVPELTPTQKDPWDCRLQAVCGAFDVDLIRVPRHFAGLQDVRPA